MRRVVVVLAAVLALVAACGGEKRPEGPSGGRSGSVVAKPSFEEKDASSVTAVTVTEFTFQLASTNLKGPKVFLEVKNSGQLQHELVITKPGQTDDEGELAATDKIPPGDGRDLAVELKPGRYQFACFIKTTGSDGTVVDHYRSGTHVEVEVTG